MFRFTMCLYRLSAGAKLKTIVGDAGSPVCRKKQKYHHISSKFETVLAIDNKTENLDTWYTCISYKKPLVRNRRLDISQF